MSNLSNNRLNVTATAAQIAAVKTALQTIQTNLPFLIGLTTEERISLPSMNVSNKAFTEDAINAATNNPTLVPAYISVPNMQSDLALLKQMEEILLLTQQLCERIDDTRLLAGSEAYNAARLFYQATKSAAEAGVPGADTIANQLGERFTSSGNNPNPQPTPPVNP